MLFSYPESSVGSPPNTSSHAIVIIIVIIIYIPSSLSVTREHNYRDGSIGYVQELDHLESESLLNALTLGLATINLLVSVIFKQE